MTLDRYTCADCGQSTENWQLICDACAPNYSDAEPIVVPPRSWADETDGDMA